MTARPEYNPNPAGTDGDKPGVTLFAFRGKWSDVVGAPIAFPEPARARTSRVVVFFSTGEQFDAAGILFFDKEVTAKRLYRAFENRLGGYTRDDPRYARVVPKVAERFPRRRNVIVVWIDGLDTPPPWREIVLGCLRTR